MIINLLSILRKNKLAVFILCATIFSCSEYKISNNNNFITVLGIAQDAGYPHIGCKKDCCNKNIGDNKYYVTSIGLTDIENDKYYLFEATPDIGEQIKYLKSGINACTYRPLFWINVFRQRGSRS